jgi:Haem-NO-binding
VHGVIFSSFRDYLSAVHGANVASRVLEGEPIYLLSEAYPDEDLVRLFQRTRKLTQQDADALLEDFGTYMGEHTFTRLYPAFYAIAPSAREFLLTVETRIHELVRATIPNAAPPELHVAELGQEGVTITYASPRRLCRLLRGLTTGTARHYGESAAIEETTCMHRGAERCTFEVRLSRA